MSTHREAVPFLAFAAFVTGESLHVDGGQSVGHSDTWMVDIVHSTVGFMARHMLSSKVRGSFTRVKGEVQLPEGSSIPLSMAGEIEAGSVDTRDEGRTATRLAALDA